MGQPQFGLYNGNNILLSYSVTIKCLQQQIPEESVIISLEFRKQMSQTHWHLLAESSDVKNGNFGYEFPFLIFVVAAKYLNLFDLQV